MSVFRFTGSSLASLPPCPRLAALAALPCPPAKPCPPLRQQRRAHVVRRLERVAVAVDRHRRAGCCPCCWPFWPPGIVTPWSDMHERYALNALVSMPPPAPRPGEADPEGRALGQEVGTRLLRRLELARGRTRRRRRRCRCHCSPVCRLPVWVCGAPPSWNDPGGAPADDWPHRRAALDPVASRRSRRSRAGRRRAASGSRHRPASRPARPRCAAGRRRARARAVTGRGGSGRRAAASAPGKDDKRQRGQRDEKTRSALLAHASNVVKPCLGIT